mgnify:FL=1|jgi:hypothetical protein
MSILKNLFAAVGAVTLGAVAVGVVLGATTAMTADDDDFDLDEMRDDAPCGGCRKCAEKNAEKDADNEDEDDEPVVLVHVVKVPCSMPEEKDKNGEKKASDADAEKVKEKPAVKVEENPTEKAEEPETSAEAEEDKAEKQ